MVYRCEECNMEFKTLGRYNNHLTTKHGSPHLPSRPSDDKKPEKPVEPVGEVKAGSEVQIVNRSVNVEIIPDAPSTGSGVATAEGAVVDDHNAQNIGRAIAQTESFICKHFADSPFDNDELRAVQSAWADVLNDWTKTASPAQVGAIALGIVHVGIIASRIEAFNKKRQGGKRKEAYIPTEQSAQMVDAPPLMPSASPTGKDGTKRVPLPM